MAETPNRWALVAVLLGGAGTAFALGVVGQQLGRPRALDSYGFSTVQSFKSWVGTVVLVLVVFQLVTAAWMYGWLRFTGPAPRWVRPMHRASGVLAVLTSLPVAYYCLYGFGFDDTTGRALAHSLAGCAFYGVFVAKMLALRIRGLSPLVLPVLGGLTFTAFVTTWWTAAWWWFQLVGWVR